MMLRKKFGPLGISFIVVVFFVSLLVAGCGSAHTFGSISGVGNDMEVSSPAALFANIKEHYPRQDRFSATGKAILRFDQKEVNTRIELTLVRNRGIRLVAMPFPLVVAGRAWITPEGMTVTDAINKRYVTASYSQLSELTGIELSYRAFESLFLAQLFKADGASIVASDLLLSTGAQKGHLLSYQDNRKMEYISEIGSNRRPLSISIYDPSTHYRLATTYSSFRKYGAEHNLPANFLLQVLHLGQVKGSLSLDLSKMRFTDIDETDVIPRVNTSTYRRMTLEDLSELF